MTLALALNRSPPASGWKALLARDPYIRVQCSRLYRSILMILWMFDGVRYEVFPYSTMQVHRHVFESAHPIVSPICGIDDKAFCVQTWRAYRYIAKKEFKWSLSTGFCCLAAIALCWLTSIKRPIAGSQGSSYPLRKIPMAASSSRSNRRWGTFRF